MLIGLAVSIGLHEVGHLLPAKLFGVKVTQYMIGFGKTIWSRRKGETEYGVKMIPLGGYIAMSGMFPPAHPGEKARDASTGFLDSMAQDAREASAETIDEGEDRRTFYRLPVWKKIIIMLGGPAMNILLAFLIFLGINVFHGVYQPTLEVAHVSECAIRADREDQTCTDADPLTPAKAAGIRVGDTLVSFNGVALTSWEQMGDLIRANRDAPATVVVERGGAEVALPTVNTVLNHVPDRLDPTTYVEAGFLGVSPNQELVHGGPVATVQQMWTLTKQSAVALASFPVRVYAVAADLVTGQPRDPNSPVSIVGASRVAGEIGASDQLGVGDKAATWFSLLGSVNLFVALLNLVPLLPLDGGHVAGALWEGLRRQLARLRRRPDPGPVDVAKALPLVYVVSVVLIAMSLMLLYADIVRPITLRG